MEASMQFLREGEEIRRAMLVRRRDCDCFAACLLAASGGLARQRLPDGSAPLSPPSTIPANPSNASRAYSPFLPQTVLTWSSAARGPSRSRFRYRSVSPAHMHLARSLLLSRHIPMFSIAPEHLSRLLTGSSATFRFPSTHLRHALSLFPFSALSLFLSALRTPIISLASIRY